MLSPLKYLTPAKKFLSHDFLFSIASVVTASLFFSYQAYDPSVTNKIEGKLEATAEEAQFINDKLSQFGVVNSHEKCKIYKVLYKKASDVFLEVSGGYNNFHVVLSSPYFHPGDSKFTEAYGQEISPFSFKYKNCTLEEVNENDSFIDARNEIICQEAYLMESREEMDMSLQKIAYLINNNYNIKLSQACGIYGIGAAMIHKFGLNYFKLQPRVSNIPLYVGLLGAMTKVWDTQEKMIDRLCSSLKNTMVLTCLENSRVLYNLEKKKYLSGLKSFMITKKGNDWVTDIKYGPTSRAVSIIHSNLVIQLNEYNE